MTTGSKEYRWGFSFGLLPLNENDGSIKIVKTASTTWAWKGQVSHDAASKISVVGLVE